MTATISINVPTLTDNATWFANAAAWTNYWAGVEGEVTLDPIATTTYTASPYAELAPYQLTIDTDVYVFPTQTMYLEMKARLDGLNASYVAMRQAMVNAGLITNP